MKQHADIAVAEEEKFCKHNVKQEPDEDQNTPPSMVTGHSKNLSKTSEDEKKKDNKNSSWHSLKKYSSKKGDTSKGSSDNYEVDRHKKGSRRVEVLKPVSS